ncbi:MAG: inorganic phosphate transporter, partial [Gemmatimonadetes bacterium]|nr:inorganic phosphate transporter [Gemmatimonadota bacterium]
ARTVGKGMIDITIVTPDVILAGLVGAIAWNLITWYFGLPSSSSHALLGGYAGAAIARAGFSAIIPAGWTKTIIFIFMSPLIGMLLGYSLMVVTFWLFRHKAPRQVDRWFRVLQLASSALFSLSHGSNDAQKTMGIVVSLLVSANALFATETGLLHHFFLPNADHIPFWVMLWAHIAIASGTAFGGWRIVHTMGTRITKLRPVGGFCAESGGAMSILLATKFGIPVSTTHTITGSIVGVGATHRLSAVRWGIAGRIVWAWILTIPASAAIAGTTYLVLHLLRPA